MKQKFQIILACVAFIGLSLWASWPKGEPSWGGKTVSEWLVEFFPDGRHPRNGDDYEALEKELDGLARRRQSAEEAMRNLGEAAVPTVLASLTGPRLTLNWLKPVAEKLEWKLPETPSKKLRVARAKLALEALGDNARAAVPKLKRMLDDEAIFYTAAMCLSKMGVLGVPALAGCLNRPDEDHRLTGLFHLGTVGTNALAASPTVLAALNDPNPMVAGEAPFTYVRIEPDKGRLLATLQHWIQTDAVSPFPLMKAIEGVAIYHRPHGMEIHPLIVELLRLVDNTDDKIKVRALDVLAKFGESAAPAKPAALMAMQSEAKTVRQSGCRLLAALGLEPETSVPLLIKLARDDPDEHVRFAALYAVVDYGRAALPFCDEFTAQVEKAIKENEETVKEKAQSAKAKKWRLFP